MAVVMAVSFDASLVETETMGGDCCASSHEKPSNKSSRGQHVRALADGGSRLQHRHPTYIYMDWYANLFASKV